MAFHGEALSSCGLIDLDLSVTDIVAVSGDGPNVCGHLLLHIPAGGGYYFHVSDPYDYPRYMTETGYKRYLKESGKTELNRMRVDIPDPDAAERYLEDLMSQKWAWLVLPHNCVNFCEEVIAAGGGTWASASNCPSIATAPTVSDRVQDFLNRAYGELYRYYGIPR